MEDVNNEKDFFKDTVDKEIITWVTKRYREIPYSIKSDYGYAYNFMSEKLKKEFMLSDSKIGKKSAIEIAAEIASCDTCDTKDISIRNIVHYDFDQTKFGKYEGTLFRSNVFVNLITESPNGSKTIDNMIVPLMWRLRSKEEIEADKILRESIKNNDLTLIKQNPIGLEILESSIINDHSNS